MASVRTHTHVRTRTRGHAFAPRLSCAHARVLSPAGSEVCNFFVRCSLISRLFAILKCESGERPRPEQGGCRRGARCPGVDGLGSR